MTAHLGRPQGFYQVLCEKYVIVSPDFRPVSSSLETPGLLTMPFNFKPSIFNLELRC